MPRRTDAILALAACVLSTGHALLQGEAELSQARSGLRAQLEQAKPYRDLFGQIAKAVADKVAEQRAAELKKAPQPVEPGSPVQPGSPADAKELGKKAQEWIQAQVTPLLRGAKANTTSLAKMAGEAFQKAAKQAADGAAKAAKQAADAVTPDSVKFLTKANSAGFTSNVMAMKEEPRDGRTFVSLASNSGLSNPKMGMAGVLGSVVNQDGSAKTGSLALAYSQGKKPVFVSMDMELPARTEKGMQFTQAISEKIRDGHGHASNLERMMEASLEKELPEVP